MYIIVRNKQKSNSKYNYHEMYMFFIKKIFSKIIFCNACGFPERIELSKYFCDCLSYSKVVSTTLSNLVMGSVFIVIESHGGSFYFPSFLLILGQVM